MFPRDLSNCRRIAYITMAALAYIEDSVQKPKLYLENNVQKGVTLIGSLLQAGVRRFVLSSTCVTY